MDDLEKIAIYGLVNIIIATFSSASGTGGGIMSIPLLITLGLNPANAIATAKFSGFGQAAGASTRFYKEKIISKRQFIRFACLSVVFALLGSVTLVLIQDKQVLLQDIIGWIILLIGLPLLYIKKTKFQNRVYSRFIKSLGALLLGIVIALTSALGSGIGSLQMIIFMLFFGLQPLKALALQRALLIIVTLVSLSIFIFTGLIDYRFGVVGLCSALIGGYLGAHLAVKKGDKFIMNLFAIVSAVLALKLIFS